MLIDMGVQSGNRCFATQRGYGLVLQLQCVTKSLLFLFIYLFFFFCKKPKMIVDELVFVLLFNCCIQ